MTFREVRWAVYSFYEVAHMLLRGRWPANRCERERER